MKKIILFLLLVSTALHAADELNLRTLNTTVEVAVFEPATFKVDLEPKVGWTKDDKIQAFNESWKLSSDKIKIINNGNDVYCWAPPGTYTVNYSKTVINWSKQDLDQREFNITIKVSGDTPTPTPTPIADNPLPGDGLKVLIIEEQTERRGHEVLFSGEIRELLDRHAAKDANGNPEWRILDKDTVFATDNQWKRALNYKKDQRSSPFWVIISDGKNFESRPLPDTITEMTQLILKYVKE